MIVDCHSHILPGIDDGSVDLNESALLLTSLKTSGINYVILTSHYYVYEQSVDAFLEKRNNAFQKLISLDVAKDMRFSLGSEVFINDFIFNLENLEPLTINNTSYILAELPFEPKLNKTTVKNVEKLMIKYSLTPILAHIDRYPYFFDKGILREFIDMGCLTQMNIQGLCHKHGRKKLLNYIDSGFIDFFGNDVHRNPFIPERYEKGLTYIKKTIGEDRILSMNKEIIDLLF